MALTFIPTPPALLRRVSALRAQDRRLGKAIDAALPLIMRTALSGGITIPELASQLDRALDRTNDPIPRSTVRRIVARLAATYVPQPGGSDDDDWVPVVIVTEHPSETWDGEDGIRRPVGIVCITEGGFEWATNVETTNSFDRKAGSTIFGAALALND